MGSSPGGAEDGYFILLDRLTDSLDDRILRWKRSYTARSPPSLSQIKAACSNADAMIYLHDEMIVFRDLKPANVGFDSRGVLKLFDFAFARCTAAPVSSSVCNNRLDDGDKSHSSLHGVSGWVGNGAQFSSGRSLLWDSSLANLRAKKAVRQS